VTEETIDTARPVTQDDLEYSIKITSNRILPGEKLVFRNTFSAENSDGYAVYPTYRISSLSSGSSVTSWRENLGVKDQDVVEYELDDNLPPGRYKLIANTNVKGQELKASDEFYVFRPSAEPTCNDGLQNQGESGIDCGGPCSACDTCKDGRKNGDETGVDCGGSCSPCEENRCRTCNDFNACTRDACIDGVCVNEAITPCCGNFECESGEDEKLCPADCFVESEKPVSLMTRSEVIDQVKFMARKDEDSAADFCDSVKDAEIRDECLRILAYNTNNKQYCTYLTYSVKKDACYMEFAYKGDRSVCNNIESIYLKKSCEALF
jgi:hypothetical protein